MVSLENGYEKFGVKDFDEVDDGEEHKTFIHLGSSIG